MKPIWKWIIGIAIAFVVIIAAAGWCLQRHWRPILDDRLRHTVLTASDSLYRLEYERIELNLLTGNVSLRNVRFFPDSSVYKRLQTTTNAPINLFDISVANLRVRRFNLLAAVFSNRLKIDEIRVDTPRVQWRNDARRAQDAGSDGEEGSNGEQVDDVAEALDTAGQQGPDPLSGPFHSIEIGRINLYDSYFSFTKVQDSAETENAFEKVQLSIRDVLIDSASRRDPTRFYYTRSIDLAMGSYKYEIPGSHYDVGFDSIHLQTANKTLDIIGLEYRPRISKQAFYKELGQAKDIVQLDFGRLRLEEINLFSLMRTQRIRAKRLAIDSGSVAVSNDLRYPRYPKSKIGKSPHQQLMKLGHPIQFDSVFVQGVNISYAEVSAKYEEEGKITFQRASGWLANVTNDTAFLRRNPILEADLTAFMMNTGKLHAMFTFDMLDDRGAYTYKGTLGPMDGRALNRILTPLLAAEVESAKVKGVRFDMKGTDHRNWGTFRLDYEDLKVNLLKMTEDGETAKKGLVTFLANEFLINSSNPDANGVYHTGKINYRRPPEFSFFKTLWKSLLEGIKQTAGISKEREQRLLNTAQTAKTVKEKSSQFFQNLFKKRDTEGEDEEQKQRQEVEQKEEEKENEKKN